VYFRTWNDSVISEEWIKWKEETKQGYKLEGRQSLLWRWFTAKLRSDDNLRRLYQSVVKDLNWWSNNYKKKAILGVPLNCNAENENEIIEQTMSLKFQWAEVTNSGVLEGEVEY